MVKHIILWKLKDSLGSEEKELVKKNAKAALEALAGKIPGLISVKVEICPLASSNADMLLDTSFTDSDALSGYQSHPEHKAAADKYVRPYTETRLCLDFEA